MDLASGVFNQDVSIESGVVFLVCLLEQDNSNIMSLHQVFNDVDFCFGETFDVQLQQ